MLSQTMLFSFPLCIRSRVSGVVVLLWGSLVDGVPIVVRSNFLEVGLN